jgi:hypothetical protein
MFFVVSQPEFENATTIMVTAKTEIISNNLDYTINNIVYISDLVANKNVLVVEDGAKVIVKRNDVDNSIVDIKVLASSPKEVENITKDILPEITKKISRYYQLDVDISIKIISTSVPVHRTLIVWASYIVMTIVAIGLISAIMLVLHFLDRREEKRYEENIDGESIFAHFNSNVFENINDRQERDCVLEDKNQDDVERNVELMEDKNEELSETVIEQEEQIEDEKIANKKGVEEKKDIDNINKKNEQEVLADTSQEVINAPAGLQATPGNLPIVDLEGIGFSNVSDNNIVAEGNLSDMDEDVCDVTQEDCEPTEEELKARLNELLNGKL